MEPSKELLGIADALAAQAAVVLQSEIEAPLAALRTAAETVGRAFSGSWIGYHAFVYHEGLSPPPPGAIFSQQKGLMQSFTLGSTGKWFLYDEATVRNYILELAGTPDLSDAREAAEKANDTFRSAKADILSIVQTEFDRATDSFLASLIEAIDQLKPLSPYEVACELMPRGNIVTQDMVALGQGTKIPPHIDLLSHVLSINHAFGICKGASDIARKAGSHLERKSKQRTAKSRVGTNVFIGHGRSTVWRDLKDFVQDRARLPWDEFNRVPVAGVTNVARLSEMLDAAAIAFLVMTAEDERLDGTVQARMNVIHEAGLFQGRLGFTKAIVMLEEGCQEFSNIAGLGQIRFPTGNIAAVFEEVRRVLEREQLIA